jgi:signal transduction histidine kinase
MSDPQNESAIDFSILVASSVHDLKNSIALMLFTVDDLLSNSLARDPEEQKKLTKLGSEASRINHDLVQLLTFYKLEKKNKIQIDEVFVADLLAESCARNEAQFAYNNIQVNIDCDADLRWYLDAELISGVINNILVNALVYAKSHIWISASHTDEYLSIVIDDDGEGLVEDLPVGELSSKTSAFSTGLGLVIGRQILAMHQKADRRGQLQLSNAGAGRGARIRLLIP